jgi:hypothetical protein
LLASPESPPLSRATIDDVAEQSARRQRPARVALLLALCCFLVYNANFRVINAADTICARFVPFGLWRYGTLYLDQLAPLIAEERASHGPIVRHLGRKISVYPVVTSVLLSPLYLPAVHYLDHRGWPVPEWERAARIMEKLSASLIAAITVALLYLALLRRTRPRPALLLSVAFAFGTTTWMISSQALWQHGLGQLCIAGGLLAVTSSPTATRAALLGLACGLAVGNRPIDALLLAGIGLYGLLWAGRWRLLLVLTTAFSSLLVLKYNLTATGNVFGGYGLISSTTYFDHGMLQGIAGLLASPTHGLFVFSPFLLAVPLLWRRVARVPEHRALTILLACGIVAQILFYSKLDWRGGFSFGPRWLTDLVPILIWMIAPLVAGFRSGGRAIFATAVVWSVAVEATGAFWYSGTSAAALYRPGAAANAAWDVHNAPFVAELRHPPAAFDLGIVVRGQIDTITVGEQETDHVTVGMPVRVDGWTLAGLRPPSSIRLLLNERFVADAGTYTPRTDVQRLFHTQVSEGWKAVFRVPQTGLGPQLLALQARAVPGGRFYFLGARTLTVTVAPAPRPEVFSRDLSEKALTPLSRARMQAVEAIEDHQAREGYWPTSFAKGPESDWLRGYEMNTYTTSLLVDLLGPVSAESGLDAALTRARNHLSMQIENNGLVRYHGLPKAPTIGTLGCAITPDADDTALVWRLASTGRRDLENQALAEVGRYRRPDGLYQTWLAPRSQYHCLNPGTDPDPADVGIQTNVLLWLAQADPKAAQQLCSAIGRKIGDESIWVYYEREPLLPILREADLRAAGCRIRIPARHLTTDVPGQDLWVAAARMLSEREGRQSASGRRFLLTALAANDFALLRANPPLLYQNDSTASVPRFYYSEDVGYALWLRLDALESNFL